MNASHSLTLRMEVMSGGVVSLPNVSITINSAPNTPLSQADTSARAFPKSTNVELKKTFTVSSNQILLTHTGRVLGQRPDQLLSVSGKVATRYFKLKGMANTAWCSDGDLPHSGDDCSLDKLPLLSFRKPTATVRPQSPRVVDVNHWRAENACTMLSFHATLTL